MVTQYFLNKILHSSSWPYVIEVIRSYTIGLPWWFKFTRKSGGQLTTKILSYDNSDLKICLIPTEVIRWILNAEEMKTKTKKKNQIFIVLAVLRRSV